MDEVKNEAASNSAATENAAEAKPVKKKKWPVIIGVVIAALIVLSVILSFFAGSVAKTTIEKVAPDVLGTGVTVKGVGVSILGASGSVDGLVVKTPEGFSAPHFVTLKNASGAVGVFSLLGEKPLVKRANVEGLDINCELSGEKSNISTVIDSASDFLGISGASSSEGASSASGLPLRVNKCEVKDVLVKMIMNEGVEGPKFMVGSVGAKVDAEIASGDVRLVTVVSPVSYGSTAALEIDSIAFQINVKDLTPESIVIDLVHLKGVSAVYKLGKGGSNLLEIKDAIEKFAETLGPSEGGKQSILIKKIRIEDISAKLDIGIVGKLGGNIKLPPIELENIPADSPAGMVRAITAQLIPSVGGAMGNLKEGLQGVTGETGKALKSGAKAVGSGLLDMIKRRRESTEE